MASSYREVDLKRVRLVFSSKRTRPELYRRRQLMGLLRMLTENEEKLTDAVYKDMKKNSLETIGAEIQFVKLELDVALAKLREWMDPRKVKNTFMTSMETMFIQPEPLGVVLIISPWNYPIFSALIPLIGAIAAGNCAILKPSELSPATSEVLAQLIPAYVDKDCYKVVLGGPSEAQQLLQQRFDYIFYIGSARVGKIVQEAASKFLTPVTLELGGKNPVYLDSECNLPIAARRLLWGRLLNSGQTCTSPDYVLCSPDVQEQFLELAKTILVEWYGKDPQKSKDLTRIINMKHTERLENMIKTSGRVAIGGKVCVEDCFVEPTILTNVSMKDPIMQEEIFGPVLPIVSVTSMEEAIEFINRMEKSLVVYVFSSKKDVQNAFVTRTSSGGYCGNDCILQTGAENLPFGGVGMSGMGRMKDKASFDTFSNLKSVMIRGYWGVLEKVISSRYPPYTESNVKRGRLITTRWSLPPLIPDFDEFASFILGGVCAMTFVFVLGIIWMWYFM